MRRLSQWIDNISNYVHCELIVLRMHDTELYKHCSLILCPVTAAGYGGSNVTLYNVVYECSYVP